VRVWLVGAAVALVWAGDAWAHGGGAHTGFQARVSVIEPFIPGLLVTVLGGHERLSVTNLTEKQVVILDDRGGPFVRVTPGETEVWDEPRIGAMEEPPEEEGLVRNWQIPGTADGEPFAIRGFLGYRPPPPPEPAAESPGSGLPTWAVVLAGVAGALVIGAAVAIPLARREG
jgi:hypothetical protein